MASDLKLMCVLLLLTPMYCSGSLDANVKKMDELSSSQGQLRLGARKVLEKKATTVTSSGEVRPSEFGDNAPSPTTLPASITHHSRLTYPITTPTPPTIITTPPAITTPTTPTPIITPPTTPTTTTPVLNPPTAPVTTTPTTPTTTTPAVSGTQSWCVARSNVPENSLQVALDYACGIGGADCRPTQQGGQCYQPITVAAHASYAFNSYYQKNRMAPGTCDFGGNAIITTTNPSYGSCMYSVGSSTVSTPPPATISTAPPPPATFSAVPPPPTFSTTPTTTAPVYNVSTPTGGITTPTVGGITGGIPSAGLGPSASYNTTPNFSGAPSFFQYLPSSFIFLLSLVVAVILG